MNPDDHHRADLRARWLGELALALAEAERLTSALARWRAGSAEAVLLRSRILAARAEVEALQRSELADDWAEIDPLWTLTADPVPRNDPIP